MQPVHWQEDFEMEPPNRLPLSTAVEGLLSALEEKGCRKQPLPGVVPGYRIYDAREQYIFAVHVRAHLLFYLRLPALNSSNWLREKAVEQHAGASVKQNNRGEVTIRLKSAEEVETLMRWLLTEFPFTAKAKHRGEDSRGHDG